MAYEYTRTTVNYEDVCRLIKVKTHKDSRAVVRVKDEEVRQVFCKVGSVYEKEFYKAQASGIKPQTKVVLAWIDYEDETTVELPDPKKEGVWNRYNVYRTYHDQDNMELYLREDVGQWK